MPVVRRSVLESIDVPFPPIATQTRIADLDMLLRNELKLYEKLAEKRKCFITETCMKAIRKSEKNGV